MDNNIYCPDFVKGIFKRMTSSYERMNYITSFGFSIRWRKQFLNSFNKPHQKVEIIDLLTGMGKLNYTFETSIDFLEYLVFRFHSITLWLSN